MERPKVGVATIITKGNKVLLDKRKNAHGENTFCFPGGHLEFGESLEDCAKRETKEEAGINIKNIEFAAVTNDIFKDEQKHYITVFMKAEFDSGKAEVKELDKFEMWDWYSWNDLPKPLFLPVENLLNQSYNPFGDKR